MVNGIAWHRRRRVRTASSSRVRRSGPYTPLSATSIDQAGSVQRIHCDSGFVLSASSRLRTPSTSEVLIRRMSSGTVQVNPTSRWFFDAMITSLIGVASALSANKVNGIIAATAIESADTAANLPAIVGDKPFIVIDAFSYFSL